MQRPGYDIAVIGGGLMGCAVARDAAGRGLSVFLCEQNDLASGATASTLPLVHGDLRQLIAGRTGTLRRRQRERRDLRRSAPHVVRPLEMILPHHGRMWPAWAIGGGLTLYDSFAGRDLPAWRFPDLREEPVGAWLQAELDTAFSFHDCTADPIRLAVLNALDARAHGADIRPRVRCVVAEREGPRWCLSLESVEGERFSVTAKALVNATGAEAVEIADHVIHTSHDLRARFLRDRMMVVAAAGPVDRGFVLAAADGRLVWVLPYAEGQVLIGVQGEVFGGSADQARFGRRDAIELCDVVNQYARIPVHPDDAVAGASALWAMPDGSDLDRDDYAIDVDAPPHLAPLATVFGGSLTTHRLAAERVLERLGRVFPAIAPWTAGRPLPGGGFPVDGADQLLQALTVSYPFLGSIHARRLVDVYGTRAASLMAGATGADDFGAWYGAYLTEREIAFLCREEWALTAEDIVWRRSGLRHGFDPDRLPALRQAVARYRTPMQHRDAA